MRAERCRLYVGTICTSVAVVLGGTDPFVLLVGTFGDLSSCIYLYIAATFFIIHLETSNKLCVCSLSSNRSPN